MGSDYGDYIVYVDESGDHGLGSINPDYPVFVLAFCVFRKRDYCRRTVPALQDFKFRYFGHDMVVLHEREIRKRQEPFDILNEAEVRESFLEDLTGLIVDAPFKLIAAVIDKRRLKTRYETPRNPYHLALGFCLERLHMFLKRRRQTELATHVVFEGRGRKEDQELELEFRRVCDGRNYGSHRLPFDVQIVDKRVNSCGLQLADLVARPIGRHVLDPDQRNRAFEELDEKFDRYGDKLHGYGLKIFP